MKVSVAIRFVVVGIAVAWVLSYGTVHTLATDETVRQVLVSADGRTLAGTLTGCHSGYLETEELDNWVVVRLHSTPSVMLAPGICAMQSFTASLRRPLGKRVIVDGVTHQAVVAFDGGVILRPATLPAGFVHRYDTASFPVETVVGARSGCVQLYTTDEGYDESIWITQSPGARWQPVDGLTEQPVTVRGHPGTAVPGEIEWTENGQLVTIESRAYAYAVLSTRQLVAIGNSLH